MKGLLIAILCVLIAVGIAMIIELGLIVEGTATIHDLVLELTEQGAAKK